MVAAVTGPSRASRASCYPAVMPDHPAIVTIQEAAVILGVSRQALYNRVRHGDVPSRIAPTGQRVIRWAELQRWRKVNGRLVRRQE